MRTTALYALALGAACNHATGLDLVDDTTAVDMAGPDLSAVDLARPDLTTPPARPSCGPAQPGYGGPLCGPPGMPCRLLRDEQLPTPPAFRNGAPEIAVDVQARAHVMLENADGGYTSFLALRDTTGWSLAPTPVGSATGLLALAPDGSDETLEYDGAFGLYYARRSASGWSTPERFAGTEDIAWPHALAADAVGCLYGAVRLDQVPSLVTHAPSTKGWTRAPLLAGNPTTGDTTWPRLALAPGGRPEVVSWVGDGQQQGTKLLWIAPPDAPETVATSPPWPQNEELGFAVAPGGDALATPTVAYVDGAGDLVLATRAGGGWSSTVLAKGASISSTCGVPPTMPGQSCITDATDEHPIAVLASAGGDVRVVAAAVHHVQTMTSQCYPLDGEPDMGLPGPGCQWAASSDTTDGRLSVFWLGSSGPAQADVGAIASGDGSAALDAQGNVHVVVYEYGASSSDSVVHYVMFGP